MPDGLPDRAAAPTMTSTDDAIARFLADSRAAIGRVIDAPAPWNRVASADAIRHFAFGISDDNPLWIDPTYARASPYRALVAPPTFLLSVHYPVLHGAPTPVPLTAVLAELDLRWNAPIREGDAFTATSQQTALTETRDRRGRQAIVLTTTSEYRNQHDKVVASATAQSARVAARPVAPQEPYAYSSDELHAIHAAIAAERRTGAERPAAELLRPGAQLPPFVRGPLTIGDLIGWQAGAGPGYRAGTLGYRDVLDAPHKAVTLPAVGWPVHDAQAHDDARLGPERGHALPFDRGAMRFAWCSVLVTNWIGDRGFLRRLRVRCVAPVVYGDTTWYAATIAAVERAPDGTAVFLRLDGTNQRGTVTTTGSAEAFFPDDPHAWLASRGQVSVSGVAARPSARADLRDPVVCRVLSGPPAAAALHCGNTTLSFGELRRAAAAVAARLHEVGIGAGAVVAHVIERSVDAGVGIFGILEAGATVLPLDATAPARQLAQCIAAARADAVLTHTRLLDRTSAADLPVLCIDDDHRTRRARPLVSPPPDGERLTFVLFTSGSSGMPRAVEIPAASVLVYLDALAATLPVTAEDIYLHSAPLGFSAAMRQLLFPLSRGAAVVMADAAERVDPVELRAVMHARAVTVWDTVPTVWHACMEAWRGQPSTDPGRGADRLRLIASTGEALPWRLVDAWRREHGTRAEIWNLYSQTETCGTVCAHRISEDEPRSALFVPIGRALPHTTVAVLDAELQPVIGDAIGEICVSGTRLARGYRHAAAASAARFATAAGTGARLVRTGDLGRRRPDGTLEWVGRADRQIKIRGMRVDLGELEEVLRSHPRVSAVAIGTDDRAGLHVGLTARVVASGGVTAAEVRAFARERLPAHMVPRRFALIDRLPMTASGKSAPGRVGTVSPGEPSAWPSASADTPAEARLLALWRELLESPTLGVDDEFFAAGGDSLLAVELMMRVDRMYGRHVPIETLIEAPTVRAFARALGTAGLALHTLHALQPRGRRSPFFCIHGLTGDVLWYAELAGQLAPDQPFHALAAPGLDERVAPFSTIAAIAQAYRKQIKRVQPSGPYRLGGASFGGTVALEVAQQLRAVGDEVAALVIFDHIPPPYRPPDPLQPRLIRRWITNVPAWLRAFIALDRDRRRARMARKLRRAGARMLRRPFGGAAPREHTRAADVIDYARMLPPHRRRLIEAHLRALRGYVPEPYDGRVTLFRAAVRPLFDVRDPAERWRELARGGVDVIDIRATHEGMFRRPHVDDVAHALRAVLASADSTGEESPCARTLSANEGEMVG
jgi:amino acid adenylation domain-containing protein